MALDVRHALFAGRRAFRALVSAALVLLGLLIVFGGGRLIGDHPRGVAQLAGLLAVVGVLGRTLLGLLGARTRRGTILELDLTKPVVEKESASPLARFNAASKPMAIREVVAVLERAGNDKRVAGLFARIGEPGAGAIADELRDAVIAFRATGKFAVAFAHSFDIQGGYYVATAFDEIAVQASGDVNVRGWLAPGFFVRGVLDKLGIEAKLGQRYEYKNAVNQLTETAFTPAHREATVRLTESRFEQLVDAVAERRNMTPDAARATLMNGPYGAPEAVGAGLVDRIAYYDQAVEAVKARAGAGAKLLYLRKYAKRTKRGADRGPTIALVHAVGGVMPGKSGGWSPLTQGPTMGADTVSAALRAAVKDKKVKAIVLRVDSPGGSHNASDQIWREVVQARAAGKPVIASMGQVAASGGYYISMSADRIVASPGTITGSIGVFAGKYYVRELQKKLGVSVDEVHEGAMATYESASWDYTKEQWEYLQNRLDFIYDDFTEKAAEGRRMPLEQLKELAKGRVWSGKDAHERGLVDDLGGFATAFRVAREAAGLKPDARIKVKEFPKKKGALSQVGSRPDSSETIGAPTYAAAPVAGMVEAAVAAALPAGASMALYEAWRIVNGGALTMDPTPPMA